MLTIKNKKKTSFFIVAVLLLVVFLFDINIGWAETGSFGDMRISNYLKQVAISPDVNLSGDRPEITTVIGTILYGVLGFLGVVCLLLTIYAGLKWMLAEGNEETISESKKIIFYSIIGLAIIMGAYAMTSFVIDKVWESTKPNAGVTGDLKLDKSGINVDGPIECTDPADCPECTPPNNNSTAERRCDSGKCSCETIWNR